MPNNKATFCTHCGCDVSYSLDSTRESVMVRGLEFSYVEMHAYCNECGNQVYVPDVNDENVRAREEGYRKAAKLITVTEINEILEKYNIGAGPLARLLGFGDITINRYITGQIPSRTHSDILLRIRASHKEMEEYLEKGKDRISVIAYTKCRTALNDINSLYGSSRIELVTRYLLCKAIDITPMALQKLLYFAQAFYYALFGEELFPDDCQAWAYGPVFPDIYFKYREYGYNPIDRPTDSLGEDLDELTTKEVSLLDAIIDSFGGCSGPVLREITHNERPWLEARGDLLPDDRSMTIINRETIINYFANVVREYQIVNPCDISNYCEAMLKRI